MKSIKVILVSVLLLLALCACLYRYFPLPKEDDLRRETSASITKEISDADEEAEYLINSEHNAERWLNTKYAFFLIKGNKVIAWSKNDYVPEPLSYQGEFEIKILQNNKGVFLLKKWKKTDGSFLLLLLPLHFQYGIINDYLNTTKSYLIPSNCSIVNEKSSKGICVDVPNSKCLFRIQVNKTEFIQNSLLAKLLIVCTLLIVVLLLVLVNLILYAKVSVWKYEFLFLGNLLFLITVRVFMVKLNFPGVFISSVLFDPSYYASSSFNASIGDLFLNSCVIFALSFFLFIFFNRFTFIRRLNRLNSLAGYLLAVTFVFATYLSFLFPYLYVESVYHNSSISLEITDSLSFDYFRLLAFASILLGCISSFLIIRLLFKLILFTNRISHIYFIYTFILGSTCFLFFFLWDEKNYWITLAMGCVFIPIIFFSKIAPRNKGRSFRDYVYLLLMIIAFSLECALSVYKFNEEKKTNSQFKFGTNYLIDQDFLAEFLLHESSKSISKDEEIKYALKMKNSSSKIKERITQYYLTSYFDRYEISVTAFSDDSTSTYLKKIKQLTTSSNKSSFDDLYFINDPASDTLKRYLSFIPMPSDNRLDSNFIIIDLVLKKIIPETVFPELLVDNRYGKDFRNHDFSYALFSEEKIGSRFGNFNYEKLFDSNWLGLSELYNEGLIENGYRHVAMEYQPHRIAVISAPIYPLGYIIINFSFYMALGLVFIFILLLSTALLSRIRGTRLGYVARIQLYVYLSFFIPLLIVSLVILRLIIISAKNQKETEYLSKAKILEERISPFLDSYKSDASNYKGQLETKLIEMAELANLDATVFSKDGFMIASSEPLIFEDQLLSGIMNRNAWHSIIMNHENYSVQSESLGKLFYNCVYWSIKSPMSGEVTAILSIPFFESASSLERTEINVVSAILGVFSIAFIIFSLLAYFVLNGLTAPLKFITNALRKISLSGENVPILWKENDELGLMAQEYNKMLVNLEESKVELQKSQKEIAWREVAQQVAHEIKNPLTPMKLSLQQLELTLLRGDVDPERSKKSIDTVLKQIDLLNEIASSFSNFASMPSLEIKPINVVELLDRTIKLFTNQITIHFNHNNIRDFMVLSDQSILLRAFSNIILNGIQATSTVKDRELMIELKTKDGNFIIAIRDNGIGISDDIKDKVFRPHFTTKATGTGLGLAIVKQTLELCNGSIWFETEVGKGTVFFIQLPLSS